MVNTLVHHGQAEIAHVISYPARATLFKQGECPTATFQIIDGVVKTVRQEAWRDVITGVYFPGWTLGTSAAVLDIPHHSCAEALVASQVRVFSAVGFRQLLQTDVSFLAATSELLAREVHDAAILAGRVGGQNPEERILTLLEALSSAARAHQHGQCRHPHLTIQEIAQMIGLSREHTSRLTNQLVRNGVLCRKNGWLFRAAPANANG